MDFNPHIALEYARSISRPRLVGSGEEEKVAEEIIAKLETFGYHIEREPFQFTRAFDIALAVEVGLALFLILCALSFPTLLSAPLRVGAVVVIGSFLLVLLFLAQPLNQIIHRHAVASVPPSGDADSPRQPFGRTLTRVYRTFNIVARLPDYSTTRPSDYPTFYLVSHFDSKSQPLPLALRIACVLIFLPATALFTLFALAQLLFTNYLLLLAAGLLALVSGLPLLFLTVGNRSPGAIDNASGTGLLLHLAEVLAARPDLRSKIHLTCLVTSAEEMATMGARYHVQRQHASLPGAYVLNFDGIGIEGRLSLAGAKSNQPLARLVETVAAELHIPLSRFNLPGALYDHIPFTEAGIDSVTLVTVGRAAWGVHTAKDSPDKLDPRGFELAGKVALRVVEELAAKEIDKLSG